MQKVLGLGSDPIWSILHYVVLLSIKYSLKWQSHETVQPERLLAAQHKCTRTVVRKNVWNCSSNLIAPSFQFKSLSIFQVCGQTLQPALSNVTAATLPWSMESKKSLERGQGFPVVLAKLNEGSLEGNTISSDGSKEWRKAKMKW